MNILNLQLIRSRFSDKSTGGYFTVDGVYECQCLEDKDRGLTSDMPLDELNKIKVFGETCIPYGRYQIIRTVSDRFTMLRGKTTILPLLLLVPGYGGVRIHTGNEPKDTEGCLLTGETETMDSIDAGTSTPAFDALDAKITQALSEGKEVWLDIIKQAA